MKPIRTLIPILILALFLSACGGPKTAEPNQPKPNQPESTQTKPNQPEPTQPKAASPTATSAQPETVSAGTFNLKDLAAGIKGLNSYKAVLQMNFDGTSNGAVTKASQRFELGVDRAAGMRILNESHEDGDGSVNGPYTATIGNLVYLQNTPDESCDAAIAADPSAPVFEPVAMLPAVSGGVEAGSESVDGVPAKVYSFDAKALKAGKGATASGKVWIADPGGWVLKYELTLNAGPDIFSEGITGKQSWAYSLSNVNKAVVELAAACPAALSGLPVPKDAINLQSTPGMITYTTPQSVEALGTFYIEQLKSAGWLTQGELPEASSSPSWLFSRVEGKKELVLLVVAQPQESGFLVKLIQTETDAPAPAK